MGRRKIHNSAQGRAEGRVRARVQQRTRGGAKRGGGASGRKRNTLDLSAVEDHVNRLADRSGSVSRLAGAASAFVGGSFAGRLLEGGTSMSDEDFRREVAEHFAILEERLQRLEEQVAGPSEQGEVEVVLPDPEGAAGADSSP